MKRFSISLLFILSIITTDALSYSGGSGTTYDPYQIATAHDLIDLGLAPNDYGNHFILIADIDLSNWIFDHAVIAADADDDSVDFQGMPFSGHFDGQGHVIKHLHIQGNAYLGLFGQISFTATVSNLGLEEATINGTDDYVGSLAGESNVLISRCFSTGSVTGNDNVGGLVGNSEGLIVSCYTICDVFGHNKTGGLLGDNDEEIVSCFSKGTVIGYHNVGGLVGENHEDGVISCYSTSNVRGNNNVGGLVGSNQEGSILSSYSIGLVEGNNHVGGLVGNNLYGNVALSFWDIESSGKTESAGGMGLPSVQMMNTKTYLKSNWDFVNEIANGTCNYWLSKENGYPQLAALEGMPPVEPSGSGTQGDPYLIIDANELGSIWNRPAAYYLLNSDIDLLGISWNTAVVPWFNGTFDGQGYCIEHLNIKGSIYSGLFGILGDAIITRLGLEDVIIEGDDLATGGVSGANWGGRISSCYVTGIVSGKEEVGGLVGVNEGSVLMSYSTALVKGILDWGGLIGESNKGRGSVLASFWDTQTSGLTHSDGGSGKITTQMHDVNTYLDAGWDFVGETSNGCRDIWYMQKNGYPRLSREQTIWFADYFPLDAAKHGLKTFEWIHGKAGTYQSKISGTIVAPYLSGSIEATGIMNYTGDEQQVFFTNNGDEVQWIASQGFDKNSNLKYISTDTNFTAPPETWTFSEITHNLYVDQGTYCVIDSNIDVIDCENDQALLFQIQDITVPSGRYHNAIVLWWLDKNYEYKPMDFHGKDSILGITPPTSEQTRGYSITDWEIYGYDIGVIAHGGGEASTGNVPEIAVLVNQEEGPTADNRHASIYLDRYVLNNGHNTFTDTFSDGLEPPSGPISGADYIVSGIFGPHREEGGLLELNPEEDGDLSNELDDVEDNSGELVIAVGSEDYFFTSGSGGYIEVEFEISKEPNSNVFIGIDNFQIPNQWGDISESIGMGLFLDSTGTTINLLWDEGNTEPFVDITSQFGTTSRVIMKLIVDRNTNSVSGELDLGANGTIDIARYRFTTLQFLGGPYAGTFSSYVAEKSTVIDNPEGNPNVIDDFETYSNYSPYLPFQTWLDGIGYFADEYFPMAYNGNGTGSCVGHDIWSGDSDNIMETNVVYQGSQSMPVYYKGVGSQIDLILDNENWTSLEPNTLSIAFYGSVGNTGQLYVKINDTKIGNNLNLPDIASTTWQFWETDLSSVSGLDNITKLSIGVEGNNADGMFYLDQIQLH